MLLNENPSISRIFPLTATVYAYDMTLGLALIFEVFLKSGAQPQLS